MVNFQLSYAKFHKLWVCPLERLAFKALLVPCNQGSLPVFSLLGVVVQSGLILFACVVLPFMEMCEVSFIFLPWKGVSVAFPVIYSYYKLHINAMP